MGQDWTAKNAVFSKHTIQPPIPGCDCGECQTGGARITPFELDTINTAIITLRRHGIEVTMTRRCAEAGAPGPVEVIDSKGYEASHPQCGWALALRDAATRVLIGLGYTIRLDRRSPFQGMIRQTDADSVTSPPLGDAEAPDAAHLCRAMPDEVLAAVRFPGSTEAVN